MLPRCPEIARRFALAHSFDPARPPKWDRWSTPKLNGLRAMWVPNIGFVSKDGVPYETGVLPHIEAALSTTALWLDGELYSHGMPLQQINARAGVIRKTPHPDHGAVQFHIFDLPAAGKGFEDRQNRIKSELRAVLDTRGAAIQHVPFKRASCADKAESAHVAYVSMGYEGTVYKDDGYYRAGLTDMMLKRKAWLDEDYEVVELIEGEGDGKHSNTLGAVALRNKAGVVFKVGSFEFTDDERLAAWAGPRPAYAKVRFMTLTDQQIPHNARVLALY